jgi:hypothetical protein
LNKSERRSPLSLAQSQNDNLRNQVQRLLETEEHSHVQILRSAKDVIVFGSRAAGVHRPDSDLDLLIVSDQSMHKKRGRLDMLFVPPERVSSPQWRRTEIARHIAAFGVSLMHEELCITPIVDEYAARGKQVRLHRLVNSLILYWHVLNDELQMKYRTRLRRELLRYLYLREGMPVPPTSMLESGTVSFDWLGNGWKQIGEAARVSPGDALWAYQIITGESHRTKPA